MEDYNTNIPDLQDDSAFVANDDPAIIKVIGVGGGGGNAVNYMYHQDIPKVNFVVLNTDKQHLDRSPVPTKVLIGYSLTHGLGAGNDPEVGRQCAEADQDVIKQLFQDQTEMVFITAGMGGAPVRLPWWRGSQKRRVCSPSVSSRCLSCSRG